MKEKKTATVSTQLNLEEKELLIKLAAAQDRTLSWVVREAVREYINSFIVENTVEVNEEEGIIKVALDDSSILLVSNRTE